MKQQTYILIISVKDEASITWEEKGFDILFWEKTSQLQIQCYSFLTKILETIIKWLPWQDFL